MSSWILLGCSYECMYLTFNEWSQSIHAHTARHVTTPEELTAMGLLKLITITETIVHSVTTTRGITKLQRKQITAGIKVTVLLINKMKHWQYVDLYCIYTSLLIHCTFFVQIYPSVEFCRLTSSEQYIDEHKDFFSLPLWWETLIFRVLAAAWHDMALWWSIFMYALENVCLAQQH